MALSEIDLATKQNFEAQIKAASNGEKRAARLTFADWLAEREQFADARSQILATIPGPVGIAVSGKNLSVRTPYLPAFVKRIKALGGVWDKERGVWRTDARHEERVRELCRDLYGTTGDDSPTLVTCRVNLDECPSGFDQCCRLGRSLVRRSGRDRNVELGEGVAIIAGGFPSSGGSVKNPSLATRDGTILEVFDVPLTLAEREVSEYEGITILRPEMDERPEIGLARDAIRRLTQEEAKALFAEFTW